MLTKEGLTVEQVGGGRFDESQVTFKIKATVSAGIAGVRLSESQQLGFAKNIIGKSFKIRRTTHTITGINMNRWKFPISTETQNGAKYKFPVARVKLLLGVK